MTFVLLAAANTRGSASGRGQRPGSCRPAHCQPGEPAPV